MELTNYCSHLMGYYLTGANCVCTDIRSNHYIKDFADFPLSRRGKPKPNAISVSPLQLGITAQAKGADVTFYR